MITTSTTSKGIPTRVEQGLQMHLGKTPSKKLKEAVTAIVIDELRRYNRNGIDRKHL